MSRTRNSFSKMFNVVTLHGTETQVTTQGAANNTNSPSAVLPIPRKHKSADAVDADPSKREVLALPLCQKKLT